MSNARTIDLRGRIPPAGGLEFVVAEVLKERHSPLARILAQRGADGQVSLRLDLDKEVFIDGAEDEARHEAIQGVAPKIARFVYSRLE